MRYRALWLRMWLDSAEAIARTWSCDSTTSWLSTKASSTYPLSFGIFFGSDRHSGTMTRAMP